jgi:hypothetical protein
MGQYDVFKVFLKYPKREFVTREIEIELKKMGTPINLGNISKSCTKLIKHGLIVARVERGLIKKIGKEKFFFKRVRVMRLNNERQI